MKILNRQTGLKGLNRIHVQLLFFYNWPIKSIILIQRFKQSSITVENHVICYTYIRIVQIRVLVNISLILYFFSCEMGFSLSRITANN